MLFNVIFWILAIWFVINVIWMWFQLNNQILQKTFAWINVCAIVIGFWVMVYLMMQAQLTVGLLL